MLYLTCVFIFIVQYIHPLALHDDPFERTHLGTDGGMGLQSWWPDLLRGRTTERRSVTEQKYVELNVWYKMIEM